MMKDYYELDMLAIRELARKVSAAALGNQISVTLSDREAAENRAMEVLCDELQSNIDRFKIEE